MIKVALLLEDQGVTMMDLSRPEEGNPGVGGTAYCFLTLGKFLLPEKEIAVTYYHYHENILPGESEVLVKDMRDALSKMISDGMDVLILKNLQTKETYQMIEESGLKTVVWAHNFLTYEEMKFFTLCSCIKRVICVGRQMYDYYLDEPVIQKMDYIFNLFLPSPKEILRKQDYSNNVTYIGSLVYEKNFHVLANAWKEIVAQVPDAHLQVIGSGQLYYRDSKLGTYQIAEENYEKLFLPSLCDDNGTLLSSVTFHGLLGDEKYQVFSNTAVGVVNPMAATETFCLCAVEMESCGIPIVTRGKNGLLDTVVNKKTGLLYQNSKDLAKYVIRLLQNETQNRNYGEQARIYAGMMFRPEKSIPEWVRVIQEVNGDIPANYHKPDNHFTNNGKWVRRMIHGLHSTKLFATIPSIHDLQKK